VIENGMLDRRFSVAPLIDWTESLSFQKVRGWSVHDVHREIKESLETTNMSSAELNALQY
jgi:hexokinase